MRNVRLGKPAGVAVIVRPRAWVGSLLLWVVFTAGAWFVLRLSTVEAVVGGFLAMLLHWVSELLHHFGHAWAARRTGWPMSGIYVGGLFLLAVSLYPREEPELPAEVHIRRALGGPLLSFLLALAAGLAAFAVGESGGLAYLLLVFMALENLLVFTIGALLPLGFTDGSTLLYWWPRRGRTGR